MFKKNLFTKIFVAVMLVALITINGFVGLGNEGIMKDNVAEAAATKAPKYVFYFIGDGLGASQRQFAEYYKNEVMGESEKLLINTLPVSGINTTHSADQLITDSAAAGTALAAGVKTNNGMISKLPNGTDVKTLVEAAEEKGMATGVISTTRLTHATPATFASHNENRNNENEIAADFLDSGVEFLAGGGYRHFVPQSWEYGKSKRKDDRNLVQEFYNQGYRVFAGETASETFRNYKPAAREKVFAALTYSHMPYEVDRKNTNEVPSLAELTSKGIDVLSRYNNGFFMMVEGGRIDHACHQNDPVGSIYDTLAFDNAVKEAYEFYQKHPKETLIVVVGDHETGGMGMGVDNGYFLDMNKLANAKISIADSLTGVYNGDRAAFYTFIAENLGLTDLTEEEKAKIEKAMDLEDAGVGYGYYEYDQAQVAAAHVLSNRANINWTTTIHTGTQIPMSTVGVGANNFGGYKDNTQIAKTMANLLGFKLN